MDGVDSDITIAQSLPPAAFTTTAFAQREVEAFWPHEWVAAIADDPRGHLQQPGGRAPVDVLGRPYYLHRGQAGQLRGFPNVCTHAWHTLVPNAGTGKVVTCPQHGRRFDEDGAYIGQPGMPEDLPDFPRPCDALRPLATASWGPLAFLRLGEGPHFEQIIQPVIESLGHLPVEQLRRIPGDHEVREVPGNWKQHAANYLDQLHIPFIHGTGLARSVHLASYQTEVHPHGVLQWATAKEPHLGFDPDLLPDRFRGAHRVFALWWFLAPNITLNFYPWGLSVNIYEPVPDRPDRTRFHWLRWSWDDEKAARMEDWHMDDVDEEDVEALAQVTRGLQSGEAVRGRFIPGQEDAVHWFHHRVAAACAATRSDDRCAQNP